ncbi:MAG: hypothetical protein RIC87_02580 [Kiloniellales bacterium]
MIPKGTDKADQNKIVYRPGVRIGHADAIEDEDLLRDCFVDTGQLDLAIETETPASIVLGRTGCGKTAFIEQIKIRCDNCIEIDLESLSLNLISNSNIIQFFQSIGVDLDIL